MNREKNNVGVFRMFWRIVAEQPKAQEELEMSGLDDDKIARNVMKRIDKPVKTKTNNSDASGNQKINENGGKVKKQEKEQDERSM